MNFDCIQYIYDPSTKEDESEMHSIGIYLRTPTTQKVHAGASIFVHRATEQNADQYYRSLFSVQARPKNS